MAKHNLARTDLLERIAAAAKPDQRDPWTRQMADSLSTAAQNSPASDTTAMTRLLRLEESLAKSAPSGNLAAYVAELTRNDTGRNETTSNETTPKGAES